MKNAYALWLKGSDSLKNAYALELYSRSLTPLRAPLRAPLPAILRALRVDLLPRRRSVRNAPHRGTRAPARSRPQLALSLVLQERVVSRCGERANAAQSVGDLAAPGGFARVVVQDGVVREADPGVERRDVVVG